MIIRHIVTNNSASPSRTLMCASLCDALLWKNLIISLSIQLNTCNYIYPSIKNRGVLPLKEAVKGILLSARDAYSGTTNLHHCFSFYLLFIYFFFLFLFYSLFLRVTVSSLIWESTNFVYIDTIDFFSELISAEPHLSFANEK